MNLHELARQRRTAQAPHQLTVVELVAHREVRAARLAIGPRAPRPLAHDIVLRARANERVERVARVGMRRVVDDHRPPATIIDDARHDLRERHAAAVPRREAVLDRRDHDRIAPRRLRVHERDVDQANLARAIGMSGRRTEVFGPRRLGIGALVREADLDRLRLRHGVRLGDQRDVRS